MPDAVLFRKAKPLDDPTTRYPGFNPRVTTLKKDAVVHEGTLPLPCDIVFEQDVAVPLRNGTIIYADIFCPVGGTNLPTIVAWSPYGKQLGTSLLDDIPGRYGVPKDASSGLEKWEGPDPAYWCAHGYAIVNPDARGAYMSEGDIHFQGTQEGQDGYDLIEWIAAREWSNGKIGMSGNSWLGICQWYIAAERPPHLAAIAPWEGFTDFYRETHYRGGIADFAFNEKITSEMSGNNRVEDVPAMSKLHPLLDAYWADKIAGLEKISIPAYVVASWTNGLHTPGTFNGYQRIASPNKWLRVHNTHEWPDYYDPYHRADLHRFFDRYLKGIDNGWERTPRVRVSLFDPPLADEVDRAAQDYPLPQTRFTPLYLNATTHTLSQAPVPEAAASSYNTDDDGNAIFSIHFDHALELVGPVKLRLWVEATDADDMDVFVLLQKLDADGNVLAPVSFEPGWTGPHGRLRASHRELDAQRSTPAQPFHTHASEQRLSAGQIVPLDIGLTPIGMRWHPGQQLRIIIAGYNPALLKFDWTVGSKTRNTGRHTIHAGGQYDSHLLVPII